MHRRSTGICIGLLTIGLPLLGACGSGDGDDEAGVTTTPTSAVTGTPVNADLTEFAITLSETTFTPGTYTFVAREQGQAPHALSIRGPGVETTSTDVLSPGDPDAPLTVTLSAGEYELWCPVGSHRAQGMETTITG